MTIETSETINLIEIENLRKWAEYMPKYFTDNLEKEKYNDRLIEDRMILNRINRLYSFIEKITRKKPNLENCNFNIGQLTPKQYDEYKELIKLPVLNIGVYGNLKLSEEEKEFCYSFVECCTKDNSFVIDKQVNDIENFFLKTYTRYLLFHHPKSDYISSEQNLQKHLATLDKNLTKRFKEISRKEAEAWRHRRKRY